ncbi:MAG: SPFH domain-containing protein [Ancalomicrobiaceae bacterium]|nr:SPFH domain-containing protein [Ancalomicrobiaceae bacterium]
MDFPAYLDTKTIVIVVVALVVLRILVTCFVLTPQYTSKIIAGFGGEFKRTTDAGFSWKLPSPLERVAYRADLTLQVTDFDVNIKTKDDNFVDLPVQIHYEIADAIKSARLPDLAKRKQVMQTLAQNVIRGHFAEGDLQKIYTSRNEMAELVRSELQKNMTDYGLTIRDVVVENPKLPTELQSSMQNVIIADRKLEAARKNAEANKVTIVAQAEGEQALLTAKAAGEKARLLAQAEGEGAIRVAQAEAEKKARLALGEGVAGEQMAIAKGFHDSIESMTQGGVTAEAAMGYLMATNRLQYNKQNIESLATAYGKIDNALLFADIQNPAGLLGDVEGNGLSAGGQVGDVKTLARLIAAVEAIKPVVNGSK